MNIFLINAMDSLYKFNGNVSEYLNLRMEKW